MALTTAERTNIVKLVVGMFNAAPGATYLAELTVAFEANGRSLSNLAKDLALTPAYKQLNPVFQTAAEFATAFLTPLGLQANAVAVDFVTAKFNAGVSKGQIAYEAIVALDASTATEFAAAKAIVTNKANVAEYYSVTKGIAQTNVGTLQQVVSTVTDTAASVTAAKTAIDTGTGNAAGNTFTLTTTIDALQGTALDDTFVADNAAVSAADTINGGGGVDTLKIYGLTAATVPVLTSVEKVYLNNVANAVGFNAAANSGITSVELDATAGAGNTVTVTTGQSVVLSNLAAGITTTTTIAGNTPAAVGLTLNGTAATAALTVDFTGTALATLNVTAQAASKANLTQTAGTALKTVNVDGASSANLVVSAGLAAQITTVSAAANTAATTGVTYDAVAASTAAGFKFTGGAGNDTVKLIAGNLATLTAGTQLDGGAGTGDKLTTTDVTANFTAGVYAKINAATGFEVLGLAGGAATVVDGAQLTSIKQFSIETNFAHSITGMATGSKVTVTAAHAANITLGSAVGVSDVGVTLNTATGAGFTVGGNLTIGHTAVALASNGNATAANVITNLKNADNSVYTITGSNALTISTTQATVTGSKYDGSAATGKLTINGNTTAYASGSALGDILIGGTAGDALKASINNSTLTGNAGADTFDVSVALGGVDSISTITDFTKGDKITFAATATAFTATKVDLSGAATLAAALNTLAAGNNSDLKWGTFGGNTYIVDDVGAGATFAATDTAVKLTGVLDLSTSTLATNTVTFA